MKGLVITCMVLAGLCATLMSARAEVDSTEILIKALVNKGVITRQDADAVREEVAKLRMEEEAKKTTFAVTGKRPIRLSGYLQERYTQSSQAGVSDSLDTKKARLTVSGDATDRMDFKMQMDFCGSRRTVSSVNFPTSKVSTTQTGKPTLVDGFLGYRVSDAGKFTLGQFLVPFSLESLTPDTSLDLINRPLVVEALAPGRDTGNQGRDVGLQYCGSASRGQSANWLIEGTAGLFNGSGTNCSDDNNHKDPVARLVFRTQPGRLHLGASYFHGAVGPDKKRRSHAGVEGMIWADGPWTLKGEYLWADDAKGKASGWYTTLVHSFNPRFQGVLRFDSHDPCKSAANDAVDTLTMGFNYNLTKGGYSRWQANYERRREEGPQVSNDQFMAQFQAGF